MLPVSSTTANCYSNSQVCVYGGYHNHKAFTVKCIIENDTILRFSNKIHHLPFKSQTPTYLKLNNLTFKHQFISTITPNDALKPDIYSEYLSKTDQDDVFAGINESLRALVCNTDTAITNTFKTVTSSLQLASESVNNAIDASVDKLKLSFTSTLSGLSSNSKGVSSKAGVIAVDGLRYVIITVEEFLTKGAMFVAYGYTSVKDMLPPDVQNVLNSSEEKVFNVLRPIGTTFQQVYIFLEGFETSLGFDPSDPIVPFVLLLGTSGALWISYWVLTYAGYAGDLSPKLTLELLNGKENVALIDVRPEARD